ncbi:unnamed protein product, partial [Sphacelaria rigidula]
PRAIKTHAPFSAVVAALERAAAAQAAKEEEGQRTQRNGASLAATTFTPHLTPGSLKAARARVGT